MAFSVVIELNDQTEQILVRPIFDSKYDAQTYVNASFNTGVFLVNDGSLVGGIPFPSNVVTLAFPSSRVRRVKITGSTARASS